jgi:hypothetical protein
MIPETPQMEWRNVVKEWCSAPHDKQTKAADRPNLCEPMPRVHGHLSTC